jgi:predicted RNase H-like nuclease
MLIVGIDLAWGENKSDGVCFIRYRRASREAWVDGFAYPQGDDALMVAIAEVLPQANPAFLAIDAPIVCPNLSGARPVDVQMSRLFHREHAGCHSANATRSPRPPRILSRLMSEGFSAGWDFAAARRESVAKSLSPLRLVAEVYPHPAMVRLLRLSRIVKYKKGRIAERHSEFARLQGLLVGLLAAEFPYLELDDETRSLLASPWSKGAEDRLDAFFCAIIGLWHLHHRGRRSQVVGDLATGFILLPEDLRAVAQ